MRNNQIMLNDALGDEAIGLDKKSARKIKREIKRSFRGKGTRELRKLFKISSDGLTFEKIDPNDFEKALFKSGVTRDQRALATGYYKGINSSSTVYHLGAKKADQDFIDHKTDLTKAGPSGVISYIKTNYKNGAAVDKNAGGGVTLNQVGRADHIYVLVTIGSISEPNYFKRNKGKAVVRIGRLGETLAHEFIGHGIHIQESSGGYSGSSQAVQVSNLWLRIKGKKYYRDGSDHGETEIMGEDKANETPLNLKKR